MSIFDCNSVLFPMLCDVYYATESQDSYGKIEKRWSLDSTRVCNLYSVADTNQSDKFGFDEKKFFNLPTAAYGRIKTDIRRSSNGMFFPLSHILITNIRIENCGQPELVMYETVGGYEQEPTIFEPTTVHPYLGPMGRLEFYQVKLDRSDTQELNSSAAC